MSQFVTDFSSSAIDALRDAIHGDVVVPSDAAYEEQRKVWNGSIDRHPGIVVRCASADDVQRAVRFGRDHDALTAVRGGGHSFPGLSVCDDGLVVDLGLMRAVRIDPAAGTVRAQGGVLLGELDRATQEHAMAVPAGIVTHTGLAGLTLGGGLGWIQRKFGLTVDSLQSVDLVTADGAMVTASEGENPDLFWAVRGGGGNFGVVTEFEFGMHALDSTVLAGPIFWAAADTERVLRFYRDWVADSPDELMTIVVQRRAPALPVVPSELVGELVLAVVVCWAGALDDGERFVRPLRELGSPLLDLCEPKPFLTHQGMFDPSFRHGCWYYVRSCDVAALTDDVIAVMAEYGNTISSPISSIALWQMGGAVASVGENDTAFNGRGAGFTFNINGNTETADGFEAEREWARSYWSALEPNHQGVYVNFLMEEGVDRVRAAYGSEKYDRLAAIKYAYDPDNFFRLNQNIPPARSGSE